jgi:hypothetical protein
VPRTPRWLLLALALLVAGGILVALPHHPSNAQRADDLKGFLRSMTTGIESCAGGVGESLYALQAITSGASHDTGTAIRIAKYGAANCSPANSMPLDDLTQYQVSESLARYNLQTAVNDYVTWAFPLAQRVQADVAAILAAPTKAAGTRDTATLRRDQRALDTMRATIDGIIRHAITATSANAQPPTLPG